MTELQTRLFAEGVWRPASDGGVMDTLDPGTGERIASVAAATGDDVDAAVASARASFDGGAWSGMVPSERGRILLRVADLIEERAAEFAEVESANQGMSLAGALAGAVPAVAKTFRYYAGATHYIEGRSMDLRMPNGLVGSAFTRREAAGVAALITPNNAPLMLTGWKVAPALAAGCSIVIKPADETPLSALMLVQTLLDAGVPADVVNALPGSGILVGAALSSHRDVDVVSFTGSTVIGKRVAEQALGNLKKVGLELGGKSPVIIFDDADLEAAIPGAARAIFNNSGQVCTAGSRLYVQSGVYEQVIAGVAEFGRKLKVGYRTEEGVEAGPLISARHKERVLGMIDEARRDGAEVVIGGNELDRPGFFVEPTIIANPGLSSAVSHDEVFGPVLSAWSFEDESEAVAAANRSRFGLAGSLWSRDVFRCTRVAKAIRAGRIGVNIHASPQVELPTGGYRESGWGRELGPNGLDLYLQDKSVVVQA